MRCLLALVLGWMALGDCTQAKADVILLEVEADGQLTFLGGPVLTVDSSGSTIETHSTSGINQARGNFEFDLSTLPQNIQISKVEFVLTTSSSPSSIPTFQPGMQIDIYDYQGHQADGVIESDDYSPNGTLVAQKSLTFAGLPAENTLSFNLSPAAVTTVQNVYTLKGFYGLSSQVNDQTAGIEVYSKEHTEASQRPSLKITYTDLSAVPEPSACMLVTLAALGLTRCRRRRPNSQFMNTEQLAP